MSIGGYFSEIFVFFLAIGESGIRMDVDDSNTHKT